MVLIMSLPQYLLHGFNYEREKEREFTPVFITDLFSMYL